MLTQNTERWLFVELIAAHFGKLNEMIYHRFSPIKIAAQLVGSKRKFKSSEVDNWVFTSEVEQGTSLSISAINVKGKVL